MIHLEQAEVAVLWSRASFVKPSCSTNVSSFGLEFFNSVTREQGVELSGMSADRYIGCGQVMSSFRRCPGQNWEPTSLHSVALTRTTDWSLFLGMLQVMENPKYLRYVYYSPRLAVDSRSV